MRHVRCTRLSKILIRHHVLSEITGLSGLRILDAILAGERNPVKLAELCHWRVKNRRDSLAKGLEGDYRPEHLFALKQSLAGYRYYQQQIGEADEEIRHYLAVTRSEERRTQVTQANQEVCL